jgi:uncharacterized protein (DUF2267 family)
MEYDDFIAAIEQSAGEISDEAAERAARAVLQTLADRLPRGEDRHIFRELPAEFKPWAYSEDDAEPLDFDDFLARAAERADTDVETALRHTRAVFAALGSALSEEAVVRLAAGLPQTFAPLVAETRNTFLGIMPGSELRQLIRLRLVGGRKPAAA